VHTLRFGCSWFRILCPVISGTKQTVDNGRNAVLDGTRSCHKVRLNRVASLCNSVVVQSAAIPWQWTSKNCTVCSENLSLMVLPTIKINRTNQSLKCWIFIALLFVCNNQHSVSGILSVLVVRQDINVKDVHHENMYRKNACFVKKMFLKHWIKALFAKLYLDQSKNY